MPTIDLGKVQADEETTASIIAKLDGGSGKIGTSVIPPIPATTVTNTPSGSIAATTAQGAIDELDATDSELVQRDRLSKFRSSIIKNGYTNPRICLIGDSMTGTCSTATASMIDSTFGISGYGFLDGNPTAGASIEYDSCVKWINGVTYLLPLGGDVSFSLYSAYSIEADTLKVYYLRQPAGGFFKIQSQKNGGAWVDEAGYTAVNTAGAIAGRVITITKTDYRSKFKLRCVGLGNNAGGAANVTIISAGIYHSTRPGAVVSYMVNSSTGINNIDAASLTARAITDPIFADLGCNLVFLSHLDGAGMVPSFQNTLQNNINAGIQTADLSVDRTPSWVIIGSPVGCDSTTDAASAAQNDAQKTLAQTRGDAFFDNRLWAGSPENALAKKFLLPSDVHYTALAYNHWIPKMFSELAIGGSTVFGNSKQNLVRMRLGASIRDGSTDQLEFSGTCAVHNKPGETGAAQFLFYPRDRVPNDANDYWSVTFVNNELLFSEPNGPGVICKNNYGQNEFCSTFTGGNQIHTHLGRDANRWGRLWLVKNNTTAGTTGNKTAVGGNAHGTVRFAAGSSTPIIVTHPDASSTVNILCQVYGVDTTLVSVRVTKGSGAFTITPNAMATAETEVAWFILP